MRLLIFTQKIDKNDTVLGFFHGWVAELSRKFDSIEVICLYKGEYDLPENVTVYSLGKERGVSKVRYVVNLYRYLSLIRGTYDAVSVHMNQEYVLLAGLYWKAKGIPAYLWRNHPAGSLLTRIAVALSTKVFCTSNRSFTARFKKTVIMPAGIDTSVFRPVEGIQRKKYSVSMIGRVSEIKRPHIALEAMRLLSSRGVQASLDIIGPVAEKDAGYDETLKKFVENNNLSAIVHFLPGVAPDKLAEVYSRYEICLNLTPAGSFDKTIVESASCGAVPLVANESLREFLPAVCVADADPESVARSIERLIDATERLKLQAELESFVSSQSLSRLVAKLQQEISMESDV
jgi:glycosyltransferase involved in cell wall biosynthesis